MAEHSRFELLMSNKLDEGLEIPWSHPLSQCSIKLVPVVVIATTSPKLKVWCIPSLPHRNLNFSKIKFLTFYKKTNFLKDFLSFTFINFHAIYYIKNFRVCQMDFLFLLNDLMKRCKKTLISIDFTWNTNLI